MNFWLIINTWQHYIKYIISIFHKKRLVLRICSIAGMLELCHLFSLQCKLKPQSHNSFWIYIKTTSPSMTVTSRKQNTPGGEDVCPEQWACCNIWKPLQVSPFPCWISETQNWSNDANVSNGDNMSCGDSCHCGQDSDVDMCSLKKPACVQTGKSIQRFVIYLYLTT